MKFTFSYEKKHLETFTIDLPDDLEELTENMRIEEGDVYIASTDHRLRDADKWHIGTKFRSDHNMPFFRKKLEKNVDNVSLIV